MVEWKSDYGILNFASSLIWLIFNHMGGAMALNYICLFGEPISA